MKKNLTPKEIQEKKRITKFAANAWRSFFHELFHLHIKQAFVGLSIAMRQVKEGKI